MKAPEYLRLDQWSAMSQFVLAFMNERPFFRSLHAQLIRVKVPQLLESSCWNHPASLFEDVGRFSILRLPEHDRGLVSIFFTTDPYNVESQSGMKRELKNIFLRLMNGLRNEAVLWTAGLVVLALLNPASDSHISICPLHNLGFTWCPGCGLGRSVSFALHGDLPGSLHAHPLGLFALLVLVSRIAVLSSTTLFARHNRQSFSHERNLHG